MKKRLILLILILLPQAIAIDCITYKECPITDCAGSARLCGSNGCSNTGCLEIDEQALYYKLSADTVIGIDTIVGVAGKFIIGALAAALIALLFPVLNIHGKLRILSIIAFLIAAGLFVGYIFAGDDILHRLLDDKWSSDDADDAVLAAINRQQVDVEENILRLPSEDYSGGKEYLLRDSIHEASLVVLEQRVQRDIGSLDLVAGANTVQMGELVLFDISEGKSERRAWQNDTLIFVMSASKRFMPDLVEAFFPQETRQKDDGRPVVRIERPREGIAKDTAMAFSIIGNTSINTGSIKVDGVSGFTSFEQSCKVINRIINCHFDAKGLKQGKNRIKVTVKDTSGTEAEEQLIFVYDSQPWSFSPIYPENESYTNVPSARFMLTDEVGLDIAQLSSQELDLFSGCTLQGDGYVCSFDNIPTYEGKNSFTISGTDTAGNSNKAGLHFIYDKTRPEIEITTKGFIVRDNIKIDENSLKMDGKRYDISKCNLLGDEYHCRYDRWISSLSVRDMAGNSYSIENRRERR